MPPGDQSTPGVRTLRGPGLAGALARVRRGVLLGVVAAVPLVFAWNVTNQPYAVPKLALLAAGVAVAGALRLVETALGGAPPALRPLALPAALVAAPAVAAWLATDYRSWALLGAYGRYEGLVPTLLVVAAGVLLADAFAGDLRPVAWALSSAAAGVGVYGVVQSLGIDPLAIPVREYAPSTIGHSNFVGGFLAIALPVALGLWTSSTGLARYAAIAASIATAVGLLFSFSQGGWLAAAGGLAVYAGAAIGPRARKLGWVAAGAVAAAGVGLVVLSLVRPFHPIVPDTTRARGLWWREAVAMGADSPVWGHGPNVYAVEGAHYRNVEDALAHDRSVADAPHSVPLSLFANHGLLGLGGFLGLVVWAVRRGLAVAAAPVPRGFAAGAAAYFTQSFVSIDMTVLVFSLWVCLAALAPAPAPSIPPRRARLPLLAGVVVAGAVAGAGLWWSTDLVVTDARVYDAVDAFGDGRTAEGLATLNRVVAADPREHYRHVYGSLLGLAAFRERDAGADEITRMEETFAYLDRFPDVQALASYGENLHRWAIFDPAVEVDALRVLRRLVELDRYSPSARVWAAEALLSLDRPAEAVDILEPLVPLVRDRFPEYGALHPEVWGALAIARFEAGDRAGAVEAQQTAHDLTGARAPDDCHVVVAAELLRRDGRRATREDLLETSPGLVLCKPATLALLPGYDPQEP